MSGASLLWRGLLLLCCALGAGAQSYVIRGTLTNSVDGAPVKHGNLTATLGGSDLVSVDAEDGGHFVLAVPGPGIWKLAASAPGYRPAALDEHERFFTGIALSPSSPTAEVVFRLSPDASLAGYVLDEAGEAVRGAQVTLLAPRRSADGDEEEQVWQRRAATRGDDRGHYEFAGLATGRYQVVVQAQPWYADGAQRRSVSAARQQVDSPLDVAYPLTWFPGVTEPALAGVVTLDGGSAGQADVRLLPVPSLHLHIPAPLLPLAGQSERMTPMPQVELVWPDGSMSRQTVRPTLGPRGEMDLGGLAPGTYRITSPNGSTPQGELRAESGSGRTIDLNAAVPLTSLTVHFDLPAGVAPAGLRLTNVETGRLVLLNGRAADSMRGGRFDPARETSEPAEGFSGGRLLERRDPPHERKIELPSGRYEVGLDNDGNQYLTGVTTEGAAVKGRFVTLGATDARLTLHIAQGRGVVTGQVLDTSGAPVAGALLLLVPSTWGDPAHFVGVHRAQSNTDGSFEMKEVLSGQYILVAVDHGWHIHWSDPAILQRFLLKGVPIDMNGARPVRETVLAQLP